MIQVLLGGFNVVAPIGVGIGYHLFVEIFPTFPTFCVREVLIVPNGAEGTTQCTCGVDDGFVGFPCLVCGHFLVFLQRSVHYDKWMYRQRSLLVAFEVVERKRNACSGTKAGFVVVTQTVVVVDFGMNQVSERMRQLDPKEMEPRTHNGSVKNILESMRLFFNVFRVFQDSVRRMNAHLGIVADMLNEIAEFGIVVRDRFVEI